ncbi:MAG: hypothetical protein LUP91_15190 [Methylococcaceae bacterium]|nr:hypothetical protein [Methylococcaceae bacterium]
MGFTPGSNVDPGKVRLGCQALAAMIQVGLCPAVIAVRPQQIDRRAGQIKIVNRKPEWD